MAPGYQLLITLIIVAILYFIIYPSKLKDIFEENLMRYAER